MPSLFFMPWTNASTSRQVGPISFVPYERGAMPGTLGGITQESLDAILGNYADRAFRQDADSTIPLRNALLLRWPGDDEREGLLSDDEIRARLQQVQLLVFAALSVRQFGGLGYYCTADSLAVIAQHFSTENPAGTAVTTRRRDGNGMSYVSGGSGKPIFLRPAHVSERSSLDVETDFATALLGVPEGSVRSRLLDAISLFNKANTDANEVPPALEIVLMRASLETLLGASHMATDLKEKLLNLMSAHLGPVAWRDGHILSQTWQKRWPKAERPLSAWIEDFCHWRNEGAHGKGGARQFDPPVWSLWNHLLFTSWFMSRIIKVYLAKHDLYVLTQDDMDELVSAEIFFTYDLLACDEQERIYWNTAMAEVMRKKLGRWLYEVTKPQP